jgi:hypothetical protein
VRQINAPETRAHPSLKAIRKTRVADVMGRVVAYSDCALLLKFVRFENFRSQFLEFVTRSFELLSLALWRSFHSALDPCTGKTFQTNLLAERQFYESYDSLIKSGSKALMTNILSIKWLSNIFLPWNNNSLDKFQYEGPNVPLFDAYARQVTSWLLAHTGSE